MTSNWIFEAHEMVMAMKGPIAFVGYFVVLFTVLGIIEKLKPHWLAKRPLADRPRYPLRRPTIAEQIESKRREIEEKMAAYGPQRHFSEARMAREGKAIRAWVESHTGKQS